MMDRDARLTGHRRGQKVCSLLSIIVHVYSTSDHIFQSDPTPPEGFETSTVWHTEPAK